MTDHHIKAVGFLFSFYKSDLSYIETFRMFKIGKIAAEEYLNPNRNYSFQKFLSEFRIARNRIAGKDSNILKITMEWISQKSPLDVHGFANKLQQRKLTHGTAISFASKILMLNSPTEILPIDSQVRESVKLYKNDYFKYIELINKYKIDNNKSIAKCLKIFAPYASQIEKSFPKIRNKIKIRENRLVDKLLWSRKSPDVSSTLHNISP